MKINKITSILIIIFLILTISACDNVTEDDKVPEREIGENLPDIDDDIIEDKDIAIIESHKYEDMIMTDWLDENTVILSKENTNLEKMSLIELADSYPQSLYLYNEDTDKYKVLKEQKDGNLGGATLSPDKKHLLYVEFTLGDPGFYVMNMETLESYNIEGAINATWVDNETIIGPSYSGGAYLSQANGQVTLVEELKDEALYIVEKINEKIYYNTAYDESLWMFDLNKNEKVSLDIEKVNDIELSPKGDKIIVLQNKEQGQVLGIYDLDGKSSSLIGEGMAFEGVSWSPDA